MGFVADTLTPTFIGGWLGAAAFLGVLYFITARRGTQRQDTAQVDEQPVKDGFFSGMATSALGDGIIRLLKGIASLWP